MIAGEKVYLAHKRSIMTAVGDSSWSRRGAFSSLEAAKNCIDLMLSPELKAVASWEDRETFSDLRLDSDLVNYAVARITLLIVED